MSDKCDEKVQEDVTLKVTDDVEPATVEAVAPVRKSAAPQPAEQKWKWLKAAGFGLLALALTFAAAAAIATTIGMLVMCQNSFHGNSLTGYGLIAVGMVMHLIIEASQSGGLSSTIAESPNILLFLGPTPFIIGHLIFQRLHSKKATAVWLLALVAGSLLLAPLPVPVYVLTQVRAMSRRTRIATLLTMISMTLAIYHSYFEHYLPQPHPAFTEPVITTPFVALFALMLLVSAVFDALNRPNTSNAPSSPSPGKPSK